MNIGHITGGTNAGWRKIPDPATPWVCECGTLNARYWVTCSTCNTHRKV